MSTARATVKAVLCLLSLIAILVGALEHENLIFQDPPAPEGSSEPADRARALPLLGQADEGDTGTESRFRKETKRPDLAPVAGVRHLLPARADEPGVVRRAANANGREAARSPIMGVLVLRL